MVVTEVRIRKAFEVGRIRAVASLTLDDQFVVHGVRVVAGDAGLFVAMPSRRDSAGTFRDIAHPITPATRERIQAAVLAAYAASGAVAAS